MNPALLAIAAGLALLPLTARAPPFPMGGVQGNSATTSREPTVPGGMYGLGAPSMMPGGYGMPFPYMYSPYVPYGPGGMGGDYGSGSGPYPAQTYGPGSQVIVDGKPGFPQNGPQPPWGSRVTVDGK